MPSSFGSSRSFQATAIIVCVRSHSPLIVVGREVQRGSRRALFPAPVAVCHGLGRLGILARCPKSFSQAMRTPLKGHLSLSSGVISLRNSISAASRKLLPSALAGLALVCFSLGLLTAPVAVYTPLKLLAAGFYAFALYWLICRPPLHFPPIKLPLAAFLWTSLISTWYWWATGLPINRMTWYRLLIFGIIPLAGNVIVRARQLRALCQIFFVESLAGGLLAPCMMGYLASLWGIQAVMGLPLAGSLVVFVLLMVLWLEARFATHVEAVQP